MSIGNPLPPSVDEAVRQRALVRALCAGIRRRAPAAPVELLETHISYVLLTGRFAYKIKKAVDLGFLDFRTLARRRHYCAEELRLNRRLAAGIYLGRIAIRGTPDAPYIDDREGIEGIAPGQGSADAAVPGDALEYAVKMVEFAQASLFDRLLAQGALPVAQIDALAERIAAFHGAAARTPPDAEIGSPRQIWRFAADNFAALSAGTDPGDATYGGRIEMLERWGRAQYDALAPTLAQRRADGYVRECHGDLHLGNIALHDGQPLVFDCIEFDATLRWIDVISEIAFLYMDLDERGRPDLAWRFVNRYLEGTGDYAGLACLRFYSVYRALVRAKIAGLRAAQEEANDAARRDRATRAHYLDYARRSIAARAPAIILMHGLSGSGKTWVSQALLERLGAVRLRSDVERKRLHALPALAHAPASADAGIYDAASSAATYQRLAALARDLVTAGFSVIIDAASLRQWQRDSVFRLADQLGVPACIVSCRAEAATLRRRLLARAAEGRDASDAGLAVLDAQLRQCDALTPAENSRTLVFDNEGNDGQAPEPVDALASALRACLSTLVPAGAPGAPRDAARPCALPRRRP